SLFIGAALGGGIGALLRFSGLFTDIRPEAYALIGMAAVLAAVVHAPLASILILFEITGEDKVLLPAMLGVIVALGTARLFSPDSLYTAALRRRGVRLGGADPARLGRIIVEQVGLEPATVVGAKEPFQEILDRAPMLQKRDLVVLDEEGRYAGFLPAEEIASAATRGGG